MIPATSVQLAVPELALVCLVGVSGSGKSSFAARHFLPTEVVSSDRCRGLVADDENDQGATEPAFALLHEITRIRLGLGRLTVVDATNVVAEFRAPLIQLATRADVDAVAIVFDLPDHVSRARSAVRTDRRLAATVLRQQRDDLRRSVDGLGGEGFAVVHVLRSVEEVDAVEVVRERLAPDRRDERGPVDLVGDVTRGNPRSLSRGGRWATTTAQTSAERPADPDPDPDSEPDPDPDPVDPRS